MLSASKLIKIQVINLNQIEIINSGPYSVVRHPIYLGWILIYTGLSFVFDSFLAIIYIPLLIVFLEIHSIFEEKYILIPNSNGKYEQYRKKNQFRLFFPPYNYVLILIAILVIYIGIENFLLI